MKNYKIIGIDGNEYYVHRNIGVSGFIFRYHNGKLQILANQRGSGTSNHNYLWNCPCGHLDYDETLKMACVREIEEECKLKINIDKLIAISINDSPSSYKQNVTHRFYSLLNKRDSTNEIGIGTEGELNEVNNVKWIYFSDIYKYKWSFDHDDVIKNICKTKIKLTKIYQLFYYVCYNIFRILTVNKNNN